MIEDILTPICRVLFPEWVGSGINSHKVVTVVRTHAIFREKYVNKNHITLKVDYDNKIYTIQLVPS